MAAKKKTIGTAPRTDKELLEEINGKLDLLLAVFGLGKNQRMSPRDLEEWAQREVHKYRDRQAKKKMLKEQGPV
jgi:hypothetical protein